MGSRVPSNYSFILFPVLFTLSVFIHPSSWTLFEQRLGPLILPSGGVSRDTPLEHPIQSGGPSKVYKDLHGEVQRRGESLSVPPQSLVSTYLKRPVLYLLRHICLLIHLKDSDIVYSTFSTPGSVSSKKINFVKDSESQ